jgi:hypothetical protein
MVSLMQRGAKRPAIEMLNWFSLATDKRGLR